MRAWLFLACLSGCFTHMFDDEPVKQPEPDPEPAPAPPPEKTVAITSCNRMRAVVTRDERSKPWRILLRTDQGLLSFDTGAPETKLSHDSTKNPNDIPNAGELRLFCGQTTLTSSPQSPLNAGGWRVGSERVIGTLGVDILDHGVLEVDAKQAYFELHEPSWRPTGRFVHVPLTLTRGILVTTARIDGVDHRVWFDTGGWLTMLFDPNADMSPPVVSTYDWVGNPIAFKETPARMSLGDGPERAIRLQRTNHYPVFEGWMGSTGIDGAIGLQSIAVEHFIIDRTRSELLLDPG